MKCLFLEIWAGGNAPGRFLAKRSRAFTGRPDSSVPPEDGHVIRWERVGAIKNGGAPFAKIELGFPPGGIGCVTLPPIGRRRLDVIDPAPLGRHVEGFESVDVERRARRWRQGDDPFPKPVELKEELDFFPADHRAYYLHCPPATGADERVLAPDPLDEIAPQGPQGAGALCWLGRGQDEQGGRGGGKQFRAALRLRRLHDGAAPTGFGVESPAFVGIETVVADGVLALGRDVLDEGGKEVGRGEDLVVFLGVPTALGAELR
jgi:hypothetical protein